MVSMEFSSGLRRQQMQVLSVAHGLYKDKDRGYGNDMRKGASQAT